MNAVVQRLDADTIADEPQLTRTPVPQREREHAAQPGDTVDAPLLEGMEDDFGVAVIGPPAVTPRRFELATQLAVVVNLAVVADPDRLVLVGHRLAGGWRQVDDRQAAMAKAASPRRIDPRAGAVGAAVTHGVPHQVDVRLGEVERAATEDQDAVDAAHDSGLTIGKNRRNAATSNTGTIVTTMRPP